MLPREEAERLLIEDGDYLVRESNDPETNEPCCVLSAYFQDHRHFILKCPDVSFGRNLSLSIRNNLCFRKKNPKSN